MSCSHKPGTCCHQPSTHSGQTFDWWRCSPDGIIMTKPTPPSPPPKVKRMPPLKKSELCWPMQKGPAQKEESAACQVSLDFWPDPWDATPKRPKPQHQRPPWKPPGLANQCGIVKYPPPYTRYCREREKTLPFICKP